MQTQVVLRGHPTQSMHQMYFDGGAVPNPGECAGAFVIYDPNGKQVICGGTYISNGTNNEGEYNGLLSGLKACVDFGVSSVHIRGDSNLVVQQVSKKWKVNKDNLQVLHKNVLELVSKIENVSIEHVLRNKNKVADQLSDETIAKKYSWISFD
jgi:ribonuclease HI